jgi:molecular chaperone GrpE
MTDKTNTKDNNEELEQAANADHEQEVSEKEENVAQSENEEETAEANDEGNVADDSTNKELTELQEKYDSLNDKYLRLYSEFENYRRRTAKEKIKTMRTAGADIVKELLPVVDDFDRAIASNEDTDDPKALKEAFMLIHNKLMRTLEQKGLKPMESMGNPFDTEYHEAITNLPTEDDEMKGKVVDVAEKGYFYQDTVLRFAKVVVGK